MSQAFKTFMRKKRPFSALMSKRSADRGEGESPGEREKAAGQRDARPVKQRGEGRPALRLGEVQWYAGLLLAAALSLYLRVFIPWSRVFSGDRVIFSSETDAWYHMMLAKGTVINLQRMWFDPMTYFPHGTPLHFGPFISWTITLISYILGLGHPSMHLVEVVGALLPAVLGTLLVIPVYLLGREIGGRSCGLISSLIVVVLPGQLFNRTILGFTDHHAAEILLSTLTMAFLFMALASGRVMTFGALRRREASTRRPLAYAALAGVALGLYIDAWSSGFLFEGIILLFIMLQSIVDHLRGKGVDYMGIIGAVAFLVAALLVLPFVKPQFGFNHYLYSLFQPTILLLGALAAIAFSVLSDHLRRQGFSSYYYPGSVAAMVVLGTMGLYLLVPQFVAPVFKGLWIFQPRTGGAATVGEAAPLLYYQGELDWRSMLSNFPALGDIVFLSSFFLALVGLALIVLSYLRAKRPSYLLLLVWSLVILVMTLAQNRFAYYYGVNVALLTGYLAFWAMDRAGVREAETGLQAERDPVKLVLSNGKMAVSAILIFAFLIYPALSTSQQIARYAGGPDSDWMTSTAWLQNNTPYPGMDLYGRYEYPAGGKYPYPDAAYGVMSWWDFGHLIETIGHRMPNANPFQQGIGSVTAGIPGSSPFFLAENETEAERVLAALDRNRSAYMNTKYVMIDRDMATGKFHAMAAWSSLPVSDYIAAVYQPQGEQLVPVTLWREPYYRSMTARLYIFDGSEVSGGEGVGLAYQYMELDGGVVVPVLTESPKITRNRTELEEFVRESVESGYRAEVAGMNPTDAAFPLEALQHYRLVHESETSVTSSGLKMVKTFEHVPGAVVRGSAPAGTTVSAAVAVMTNMDRIFVYSQSNVTDKGGRFTLVLPYSTEGPIASGTNFDTMPVGPYQVSAGGRTYELRVPEEAVLTGEVIDL